MASGDVAQQLEDTAALLRTFAPTTDALRAIQTAENALAAEKARLVAEMIDHVDHEAEGYSSAKSWMRDQLHLERGEASDLIKAAETFTELPEVMDAAEAGQIRLQHVKLFGYALTHVGRADTETVVDSLIDVAKTSTPSTLRGVVKKFREAVFPDSLEQAWIDGMNTHDIRLTPVGEGFHLNGFLDIETGTKLKTVLHSLGTPREAQDDRDCPSRRIDGLNQLLDAVLAHGLPATNGVRPHLTLTVDLADLVANPTSATAELAGFGTISNGLMRKMLETADLTPILTGGKSGVLDVGRRFRFATDKQKRAIDHQQNGQCETDGCTHPISDYHHIRWWSHGGLTDLEYLTGRCKTCHTEIHQGLIVIDPVTRASIRTIRSLRRRHAA